MTAVTRPATALTCYDTPAQETGDGYAIWVHQAANFTVEVIDAEKGAVFPRTGQPDEYMVITTHEGGVAVTAGNADADLAEPGLIIVPSGDSTVTAIAKGRFVRIFSSKAADRATKAYNHDAYTSGVEDVAPLTADPSPRGEDLRVYPLSEYMGVHPDKPFMLFRSASLMVNIFKIWEKPRDTTRLSPHFHADFEQCSLALLGPFTHRLRYPWGPDLAEWREDETLTLDSPSVLTIPPNVIHTTYFIGPGQGWLIDIFAPARQDFVSRPGIVLNADEYPAQHAKVEEPA